MGFLKNLFNVGRAHANDAIEKLEDPAKMIPQVIRDKEKHLADAKVAVQKCIATQRKNAALLAKEEADLAKWEQNAIKADAAGKADLIETAFARITESQGRVNQLKPVVEGEKREMSNLKSTIKSLQDDIDRLKREKDTIVAQHAVNKTKKAVYEAKAKIGKTAGADALLDRMRAKSADAGYEADAAAEMAEDATASDEDAFAALDAPSSANDVQDRLAALKAKHNS